MKRILAVLILLGAFIPSVASAAPRDICGPAAPGFARCYAKVDSRTALRATGYSPADLRSAYRLPDTGGAAETIAIVDAGDAPTAEADLAVYRQTYGLPPCTTANGCFRKVNQHGDATPLPPQQGDWPVETALDLDMASAACAQCKILLVEGDDASFDALGTSVDTAVKLGATIVSNSYGAPESHWSGDFAAHYQRRDRRDRRVER